MYIYHAYKQHTYHVHEMMCILLLYYIFSLGYRQCGISTVGRRETVYVRAVSAVDLTGMDSLKSEEL